MARVIVVGLFALMAAAATVAGQPGSFVRAERLGLPPVTDSVGSFTAAGNAIIGTARSANRSPIPEARLQLRSLRNGEIVENTLADGDGRFVFRTLEPGTYVVEMTMADGSVVALSEAVTIGAGEIIQTVVQLASRTRTFGWWFGSTTSSALSSAASLGVLTTEPGVPASPSS